MSFRKGGVWDSESAIPATRDDVVDQAAAVKELMESVIANANAGDVGDLMEDVMEAEQYFGWLRLNAHDLYVRNAKVEDI